MSYNHGQPVFPSLSIHNIPIYVYHIENGSSTLYLKENKPLYIHINIECNVHYVGELVNEFSPMINSFITKLEVIKKDGIIRVLNDNYKLVTIINGIKNLIEYIEKHK
jgi:hypothetical protein